MNRMTMFGPMAGCIDEWVLICDWELGWTAHNINDACEVQWGWTLDELVDSIRECDYPIPTIELGQLRLRWSGLWELTMNRRYLGNAPTIRELAERFHELGDAYGQYL